LYWGGDFEKVIELLNEGSINEENIRFFLGYSGWGENQLKNEVELNSWIIKDNFIGNKLISVDSKTLWSKQITSLGGEYLIWGNAPENPSHN
jgi:putative transcriptional regulator